jgi:hypothetical protein
MENNNVSCEFSALMIVLLWPLLTSILLFIPHNLSLFDWCHILIS